MVGARPLQFVAKIMYPMCKDQLARAIMGNKNDNTKQKGAENLEETAFGTRLYLDRKDIAILVFSSLVINIFSLAVPLVTLQVYDRILSFQSIGTLQVLTAGVGVVVILDIILRLCRSSIIGWNASRFEHTAFTKTMRHLMQAQLLVSGDISSSDHLHRISVIAKLKSFYSGQSLVSLIDLPFVIIFLGFIAYFSGALVLAPIALLALFSVYAFFLGKNMEKTLIMRDCDYDERINFISELLNRIHSVKMLGLESVMQRHHEALQNKNITETYSLNAQNTHGYNAASLFTQIMMVTMITVGAYMVLNGSITMGVLVACVLLSGRVMQPVQRALSFWVTFQEFQLAKKKIEGIFSLPTQKKLNVHTLKKPRGRIELKNLSFSYEDNAPIFKDLTFSIPPGESIALLGTSGDGKTTLMKILAGFYEPTGGQVLIDGHEVSQIPNGQITRYVGYLSPDAEIFQGTIMENLTSFRSDMEDQALEMAEYLGIDKIVSKMSAGYQTQLVDGPADPITPGMKQRIAIARVLVNRPRIILFDHADKSLDKEGYNHMFRLLGQLKGQATLFLVSNDRNILHLAHEEYMIMDAALVNVDHTNVSKSGDVVRPLKELSA